MLRDWLRLIRVPNVFTAMADVVMGFFFVTPAAALDARGGLTLGLLVVASSLLYSAGMVLNDVYDYEEDSRDRPDRPLPSGRIALVVARRVGFSLLAGGMATAVLASFVAGHDGPWICAASLSVLVVGYDAFLKRTFAGPIALGGCRAINVLLGMSAAATWQRDGVQVAAVIGLFMVGVSVMARPEARHDDRPTMTTRFLVLLGVALMMAAVGALWWLPDWRPILVQTPAWRGIVGLLVALVAWRCARAMVDPAPAVLQRTVGQSIRSLVVLDAVITAAVAGLAPGVAVLALLAPNLILSRWFYST